MIPLLGLTGIPALLEFLEVRLNDQKKEDISILQLLDGSLLRSPGLFYVRYLLNCTFLTNTNSLLCLVLEALWSKKRAQELASTLRPMVDERQRALELRLGLLVRCNSRLPHHCATAAGSHVSCVQGSVFGCAGALVAGDSGSLLRHQVLNLGDMMSQTSCLLFCPALPEGWTLTS